MTTDRYTRIVLTVIAAALVADAGSKLVAIPVAHAAPSMNCKIEDTVKIEGTIQVDTFSKPLSVKAAETIPVKQEKY